MARNFWVHTNSAEISTTAATLKTISQILAGTGVRSAVQSVTISFNGTSNTAQPIYCKTMRQTTAGTATARNPVQKDSDIVTALLVTGTENATAEPTASSFLLGFEVHPQAGVQYPMPLPGELMIPGAARMGVTVTPTGTNPGCTVQIEGEE